MNTGTLAYFCSVRFCAARPRGHGVIAAAAQMVFFHQLAQIIFILGGRQLKKQLAYLFLRRHPGDGFLHPAHILVRQAIRFRFQIDHGNLPFFQAKQLLSEARPPPEHSARSTIPRLLLWISILLYHLIAAKRSIFFIYFVIFLFQISKQAKKIASATLCKFSQHILHRAHCIGYRSSSAGTAPCMI